MTDTASMPPAHPDRPTLTNRQGHPVYDNQNQRTVGARGPATLENYHFLEKMSHFDRERLPERVVHARGITAFGYFEAYGAWGDEQIARFTRAKLFQERGKRTDVALRFSTVIGGRDSSELARDPRGFAVISPRGIPATYRHMQGFGVNTYKWANQQGDTVLVKYHWMPKQGVKSLTEEDAANIQATNVGHATKDLYDSIGRGDYPEWELVVQMMSDHEHPELDFDPLDDTKVWPENEFPPKPVGRLVLNRMPENFFAESEQISFGTGVLVDGLDFSDDKMLVGRTFSYSDTQRYRVGPNYLQLPVNQAKNAEVRTNQRDGQMTYFVDGAGESPHVNYEPSSLGGLAEGQYPTHDEQGPVIIGRLTRKRIPRTNDYTQAGQRYLLMHDWERDDLVRNLVANLSQCDRHIQERMVWHFLLAEDELGLRVGEGLNIKPDDVRDLEPVHGQELTDEDRKRLENLGNNGTRDVTGLKMTHSVPNERVVVTR